MGQIHPGFIADMLKHCERGEHPPLTVWEAQQLLTLAQRALAASTAPAPQEPADPMDWPLPCDVTVGNGTHRKGTSLGTLVARMRMLHREAFGDPPSPEEAARNLAELQGHASPAPGELGAVDAAAGASQGDSQ